MKRLFQLLTLSILFCACNSSPREVKQKILARLGFPEKYLLKTDSVTAFDSLELNQFIHGNRKAVRFQDDITEFYKRRNYTYAWFNGDTLNSSVYSFYNLLRVFWETGTDSLAYNEELDSLLMNTGNLPENFPDSVKKLRMEFLLTTQFFEYAKYEYEGHIRKDLRSLDWYIPRGRKNYQMLLDSLIAGVEDLKETEPVIPQYQSLKNMLIHYNDIVAADTIRINSTTDVQGIKNKLVLLGDLSSNNSSDIKTGIISFQSRIGMIPDGKVSEELVRRLNVPVKSVMRTLLINMERMRWIPDHLPHEYVFVNIPEYKLHVSSDSTEIFSMNVVVGKEASQTTIFNGKISRIIFSPYWNVPQSILEDEIVPLAQANPGYFGAKDMEVLKDGKVVDPSSVNWKKYSPDMKIRVRQKPGPQNSLGHVKFLFPNQFSIYLHDTPSRHLFDDPGRTYSHGCVRVADPVKLAAYLLKDEPGWTTDKIEEAMHAEKEKVVDLDKKVPVFIGYFTAWVDRNGKLNLREDVYDHDEKLAAALF